jgi:murein L,D-transpeptidase YafK
VKRRTIFYILGALLALAGAATALLKTEQGFAAASYVWIKHRGGYSVQDRLQMHSTAVEQRIKDKFTAVGIAYPPAELTYLAFKDSARLEVYSRATGASPWKRVLSYPILGMSGTQGPKLREGDMQVPEGIYQAEFLNPNSRFHLSIKLNYPNAFDLAQANAEGRTNPGSDIMIHGSTVSIGCLAMGNQAAEDLFILAALSGKEHVNIVVAPTDFRRTEVHTLAGSPPWLPELYRNIKAALSRFPSEA